MKSPEVEWKQAVKNNMGPHANGEQRNRIYWTPHKSRKREREFVEFLALRLSGDLVNQRFTLDPKTLDSELDTRELLACLEADRSLPAVKRQRCIETLKTLPTQIRVAREISRISFDVVVERHGRIYYWEFHEKQHRTLTVDRPEPIYGPHGKEEFRVPRYLQRLIRDIWRIKAYPDLTIVWWDWFETHRASYDPSIAFGFREYQLPGEFSFGSFCSR